MGLIYFHLSFWIQFFLFAESQRSFEMQKNAIELNIFYERPLFVLNRRMENDTKSQKWTSCRKLAQKGLICNPMGGR